jgi:DNA-binding response OmpR family regulator
MIYCFADCQLDVARRELRRADRVIALEPKVFQVLTYLLERHDQVVSKEEFFAHCWPDTFVTDAALARCLVKIRAAIQSNRQQPSIIRTVHGQGYRFVTPVTIHEVDSALTTDSTPPPPVLVTVAEPVDSEQPPNGGPLATILVVDDEAKNVKLLDALLTPRGYRVVTAADGETALRQVEALQPDLVLLDVMMPVMDGFEVCRRLKDHPRTCLIPVIIMTALDRLQDRVQGIDAGADDFLTKPVHREELLARVRTSLRTRQAIERQVRSSSRPLYLTLQRQGDQLLLDLAGLDSVPPRASVQFDEGLLGEMSDVYTRIVVQNAHPEHDANALQNLGELIAGYLFPASIRQQLDEAAPTDLLLRLDDSLLQVPWEWAYSGNTFLLDKFCVGRQVLGEQPTPTSLRRVRDATCRDRLRLLLIVDPTASVPEAVEAAEQLVTRLSGYPRLDVRLLQGKQLRKLDLLQALSDSDLVHFIGLIHVDVVRPECSGWQLADTVLTASELSRLTLPPLLVLAYAAQGSTAGDHLPGLQVGREFMLAGVQHYLIPCRVRHSVDQASFAADIYHHLLHGEPVGHALAAARTKVSQATSANTALWTRFIHYGNPASTLPGL